MGVRVVFYRLEVFDEDAFFVTEEERDEVRSMHEALDLRTLERFKPYEKYLGLASAIHLFGIADGAGITYRYDAPWYAEFNTRLKTDSRDIRERLETIGRAADDADRKAEARFKRRIKALSNDSRIQEMVKKRITVSALIEHIRENHLGEDENVDEAALKREVGSLRAIISASN